MKLCEFCGAEHDGSFGSGRFCRQICSNKWVQLHYKKKIGEGQSRAIQNKILDGSYRSSVSVLSEEQKKQMIENVRKTRIENERKRLIETDFSKLKFESIKKRILIEQDFKCNKCGLTEWLQKPITLELEHKDGNHQNNSRDNLECICPNCHSMTDTWRGRNVKNKRTATRTEDEIVAAYLDTENIRQCLLKLSMTEQGNNYGRIKKVLNKYNISFSN